MHIKNLRDIFLFLPMKAIKPIEIGQHMYKY